MHEASLELPWKALRAGWLCFALENCPGEEPCLTWFSQWGEAAFRSGLLISVFSLGTYFKYADVKKAKDGFGWYDSEAFLDQCF